MGTCKYIYTLFCLIIAFSSRPIIYMPRVRTVYRTLRHTFDVLYLFMYYIVVLDRCFVFYLNNLNMNIT